MPKRKPLTQKQMELLESRMDRIPTIILMGRHEFLAKCKDWAEKREDNG